MYSIRRDLSYSIKRIQEKKTLILITCIGIILLTLFFFKLTFEEKNKSMVEKYRDTLKHNPYIKRELKPLSTCKEIKNKEFDYKLIDYYISSSFNSPLIGNQKRDYVSLDFFSEVIKSGARYLEFQINPSSIKNLPEPIVGTGDINNNWGNSTNFLNLDDVLKTIRKSAFDSNMNYPLIIYLDFNSTNKHLLKRTGELINSYLGNYVVKNSKYMNIPFVFERICVFNRKILFLSSLNKSNFMKTPLEKIILPELGFVRRVFFEDVNKQVSVELSLSQKQQKNDAKKFVEKYKTYNDILNRLDFINNSGKTFYDVLIEEDYSNPLLHFNKVGLTIVIPHKKEDIFTLNYEPHQYWDNGCQIVALNFQESLERNFLDKINNPVYKLTNNDPIIVRYLSKFNKNSFILKSDEERFFEVSNEEQPIKIFNEDEQKTLELNINSTFVNNFVSYNNKIIVCMIQSYAFQIYYLDSNSGIVRFYNKNDPNNNGKSENDYLFMFSPCKDEILNNKQGISIIPINDIVNIDVMKRKILTRNINDFVYRTVSSTSQSLISKACFYPVKTSCNEGSPTISFRIDGEYDTPYLGYDNKILSTYVKNDTNEMKESSCFNIINIPYYKENEKNNKSVKLFLYIKHNYTNRYLQGLTSNICIFKNKKPNEMNKFQIIMEKDTYDLSERFSLKINNKYLKYDKNNNKLSSNTYNIDDSSIFTLVKNKDSYNLHLLNNIGKEDTTLTNINNTPKFILNSNSKNVFKNNSLSCYIKFEVIS
jgi:hypothetical protein